ncbi:MAG: MBL fold metallo-hydrolase [Chloroflexota bacterium]
MFIKAIFRSHKAAAGYLIYAEEGGEAAIIDAPLGSTGWFVETVTNLSLTVKYIVNTHGHWDLIADNVPLVEATGATLCAHAWDSARLANPRLGVEIADEKVPPVQPSRPDQYLNDGQELEVGRLKLTVIATPGHTPGSICLYESNEHALFSGDTIIKHGVGTTDFPGGNADKLRASLLKLAALPDDTRVFPAHGLATTIREERWLLDLAKVD